MKLTTGIFLSLALQLFITKPMGEMPKAELEFKQSELDKTKCEVRDLLVRLEKKDKKRLSNRESLVTRGYKARMMSAYDDKDRDALLILKKNILHRIGTISNEPCASKAVSVQEILRKWVKFKESIDSRKNSLTLSEEGEWVLKIEEIRNDLKDYRKNSCEIDRKLNIFIQDFGFILKKEKGS